MDNILGITTKERKERKRMNTVTTSFNFGVWMVELVSVIPLAIPGVSNDCPIAKRAGGQRTKLMIHKPIIRDWGNNVFWVKWVLALRHYSYINVHLYYYCN